MKEMSKLEKEVMRMELQIEELIRIVGSLNERIRQMEDVKNKERIPIRRPPRSHLVH